MDSVSKTALVVVAGSLAYMLLKKQQRPSIFDIRGPDDCASFLLGLSTPRHFLILALAQLMT